MKKYHEFNNIAEEKIFKFSEYNPTQYNGNIIVDQIMEWLRAKFIDGNEIVEITLNTFFQECAVDKDKFMTFYHEHEKTNKINNFSMTIIGDKIEFKKL